MVLEFVWGTDMSKATQEALEKLELVFLPREAERPLLLHFDPSLDPIMELSFSGEGERYQGEPGLRRLRRLAELQIKRALEPIAGVAAVRVRGGLEEEYHVLLDKEALQRSGLSIQTVIDRLRQENINVAGGTLKEGRAEYMVRTLNEYESLEEIGETIVTRLADRNVRVKDLGRVVRTQQGPRDSDPHRRRGERADRHLQGGGRQHGRGGQGGDRGGRQNRPTRRRRRPRSPVRPPGNGTARDGLAQRLCRRGRGET